MKSAKFAIAVVGLACASAAMAENWVELGSSGQLGERTSFFFDTDSIKTIDGALFVWTLLDQSKNKKVRERSGRYRMKIDCKNDSFAVTFFIKYDSNNNTIDRSISEERYRSMNPIVPGSMVDSLKNQVCKD